MKADMNIHQRAPQQNQDTRAVLFVSHRMRHHPHHQQDEEEGLMLMRTTL